jgi:hypothetical protein
MKHNIENRKRISSLAQKSQDSKYKNDNFTLQIRRITVKSDNYTA